MFTFFAVLGCIEAMLGLSGERLWPYWGGMGVKCGKCYTDWMVRAITCGFLPRGLGAPGQNMWVLLRGLGGPMGRKNKSAQAPGGFGDGFWALGSRG
jgi:hypothetical protein